jgi:hypothetical protein
MWRMDWEEWKEEDKNGGKQNDGNCRGKREVGEK